MILCPYISSLMSLTKHHYQYWTRGFASTFDALRATPSLLEPDMYYSMSMCRVQEQKREQTSKGCSKVKFTEHVHEVVLSQLKFLAQLKHGLETSTPV